MSLEREDLSEGVLIVGAGPAGSSAAAALARAGIKVFLVDKEGFPREKVCGDGIGPLSLECLREIGVDIAALAEKYERLSHVTLVSPGGIRWRAAYQRAEEYPEGLEYGHVIERKVFDKIVLDRAIACGARFEAGWSFAGLTREREWTTSVQLSRNGEEIELKPRFLLAADGEFSTIRKKLTGINRPVEALAVRGYVEGLRNPPTDMEFHFLQGVSPGYGWIFPEGRSGRANIGVYMFQHSLARGGLSIKNCYEEFLAKLGASGGCLEGAAPCSPAQGYPITPYDPQRRVHFGNTLLLGDAAGLADILTGEGIFEALYSGLAAAHAVERAFAQGPDRAPTEYAGALARYFLPLRRRGVFVKGLLDHLPAFTNWIFGRASQDPILSARIFSVVSGSASMARLFSLTVWGRLYFPGLFSSRPGLPPVHPENVP